MMRRNRAFARLVFATMILISRASHANQLAAEGDLKKMQGRWTTTSFAGDSTTFRFEGRTLEVEGAGVHYVIAVTLDEQARPEKSIDLKTVESTTSGAIGVTSPGIYKFESEDRLLICFRGRGERPAKYETIGFEQWRVELKRQPNGTAKVAGPTVEPAAADSDAPLPKGWPGATRPGTIEVKTYPAYRSAIVRDAEAKGMKTERMFWPLFNHISRKNIAMTAPVVMTYAPQVLERTGASGEVSMEFLYARPDQGESGPGVGKVKVEDHPGGTFVCLGVQGKMDEERMREGVVRLRGWLRDHKGEWVEAGPPRELGYHGPMTRQDRRLWEVQLPVKPAHAGDGAKAGDRPISHSPASAR
jgi:uncharacterized protein (TIGR03067 family)